MCGEKYKEHGIFIMQLIILIGLWSIFCGYQVLKTDSSSSTYRALEETARPPSPLTTEYTLLPEIKIFSQEFSKGTKVKILDK